MGYSCDRQFLSFPEVIRRGGELALRAISRSKPLLKNRIEKELEAIVVAYATVLAELFFTKLLLVGEKNQENYFGVDYL